MSAGQLAAGLHVEQAVAVVDREEVVGEHQRHDGLLVGLGLGLIWL
jgi:hypothetical protein